MKTRVLIIFSIGIIGFSGTAYATHDPNQPQPHSIILPPDMREKSFEEFMEWCKPHYGEIKCAELYEKTHLIPEEPYSEHADKENSCGLGTTYQDGICVINQTENTNSSYKWENPYDAPPVAHDESSHLIPNLNPDSKIQGTIILIVVLFGIIGCFTVLFVMWRNIK
jgi:hypothetical protein